MAPSEARGQFSLDSQEKTRAAKLGIARWGGTNWAMVGGDLGGSAVFALAVNDDGNGDALFAGGILSAWIEHFTSY